MSEMSASEAQDILDKAKKAREKSCQEAIAVALKEHDCILEPRAVLRNNMPPEFSFVIIAV